MENFRILDIILYNRAFFKIGYLIQNFYDLIETSKLVLDGNVAIYKIIGSLEILAIKNLVFVWAMDFLNPLMGDP